MIPGSLPLALTIGQVVSKFFPGAAHGFFRKNPDSDDRQGVDVDPSGKANLDNPFGNIHGPS
jgi:hypothetical protein